VRSALFHLVSAEDHNKIFAFGISITGGKRDEAVVYRRDPSSGRTLFGVHGSAEAARSRYSAITPLDLVWPPPLDDRERGHRYCMPRRIR
jgi:hypothetical protein